MGAEQAVRRELARVRAARARAEAARARGPGFLEQRPRGSGWSADEHLEHVLLAEAELLERVAALAREGGSGAARGGVSRPTAAGRAVLLLRWIPRGRGRAPDPVLPRAMPAREREELARRVEALLVELERDPLRIAAARGRARHAVLGHFDARQWLRYVSIHSEHHLRRIGA